jgi:hypothetical protein
MKPRVFLSHSKVDRQFIENLANDLRSARIDVWYDEWEIPAGVSFRKRIFEDGIQESDLFFVYLSPASAASYWVERELDAAFVLDGQTRGGSVALFVDSDNTRRLLSADLQSLHSPVLNATVYDRGFWHLIGRAWEAAAGRRVERAKEEARIEILGLQKSLSDTQAQLARLENASSAGVEPTLDRLKAIVFRAKGDPSRVFSLADLFRELAGTLAMGTGRVHLEYRLKRIMSPDVEPTWQASLHDITGYHTTEIFGPLIIARLVRLSPPAGEHDETYYLTELGTVIAERLTFGSGRPEQAG